jgi:hypothetical protein
MLKSSSKSSMRDGGVFPLKIPRARARRRRRADAPFGRRAVVEALGVVARRALPKNLIRLLPVQDHKDEGFGDLLTRSPVHASDRTGVSYSDGAIARRGKNPRSIGSVLAWPAGCLYSSVQPISCRDRAPARRGVVFRRTIHAGVAHPRPSPGPASERARVGFSYSSSH